MYIQFLQHPGCVQLQIIVLAGINDDILFVLLQDHLVIQRHIHQVLLHVGCIHIQQD